MKRFILVALLLVASLLVASPLSENISGDNFYNAVMPNDDRWTVLNTILELSLWTLSTIDFQQTMHMAENNWHQPKYYYENGVRQVGHYSEYNKLLGASPTRKQVLAFGLGCNLTHAVIAYFLPRGKRELWQMGGIAFEGSVVLHNTKGGLSMNLLWKQGF